jgi:ABC-type nickel/cobalt efflux system permease component RcnA
MCVACGLPTTHSNVTQVLGWVTIFSFTLTTFLGAWWVVTSLPLKKRFESFTAKHSQTNATAESVENKS